MDGNTHTQTQFSRNRFENFPLNEMQRIRGNSLWSLWILELSSSSREICKVASTHHRRWTMIQFPYTHTHIARHHNSNGNFRSASGPQKYCWPRRVKSAGHKNFAIAISHCEMQFTPYYSILLCCCPMKYLYHLANTQFAFNRVNISKRQKLGKRPHDAHWRIRAVSHNYFCWNIPVSGQSLMTFFSSPVIMFTRERYANESRMARCVWPDRNYIIIDTQPRNWVRECGII